MGAFKEAIDKLRAQGFTMLFPVKLELTDKGKRNKIPLVKGRFGLNAVTATQGDIDQWCVVFPNAAVGLATGREAVVIDKDDITQNFVGRVLPDTRRAQTWGEGHEHFYFKHPGVSIRNDVGGSIPGCDFRGDGGYVVAPGSVFNGRVVYSWLNNRPICRLPGWFLRAKLEPSEATEGIIKAHEILDTWTGIARGEGVANEAVYNAALRVYKLVGAGLINEEYADALLLADLKDLGWTRDKEWNTVMSAKNVGLGYGEEEANNPVKWPFLLEAETRLGPNKFAVFFQTKDEADVISKLPVCSGIEVVAGSADAGAGHHGKLLRITSHRGTQLWRMPNRVLCSRDTLLPELLERGAYIEDPRRTMEYLNRTNPKAQQTIATHRGWQEGERWDFVQGDSDSLIYATEHEMHSIFGSRGTLSEWKEAVAGPCAGNARLTFFLSAAFAPALLRVLSGALGNGTTFQIEGIGTAGKTTALNVAASVAAGGGSDGGIRTWNATQVGIEHMSAEYCDYMLPLDELSSADPAQVVRIVFQTAQGQGKTRGAKDGGLRETPAWRTIVLSTSNVSLSAKANEKRSPLQRVMGEEGGTGVRWIPILADAGAGMGVVEDPHGKSAVDFTMDLNAAVARFYGTAYPAFIAELTKSLAVEGFQAAVAKGVKDHADALAGDMGSNPDAQVLRVARYFALVSFAGTLATKWGILPWGEDEAFNGARKCFLSWKQGQKSKYNDTPREVQGVLDEFQKWMQNHELNSFIRVTVGGPIGGTDTVPPPRDSFGYRVETAEGIEWMMYENQFGETVRGAAKDTLHAALAKMHEIGWLVHAEEQGANGVKKAQKEPFPGGSRRTFRAYRFTQKVLDVEQKVEES